MVCNPGSAIIRTKKKKQMNRSSTQSNGGLLERMTREGAPLVDLVDATNSDQDEEVEEEQEKKEDDAADRIRREERPPCILFLDSLKCHRKSKFANVVRK